MASAPAAPGAPLEREIRIAAPPETVFPFLMDPPKMTRWMGKRVDLDPRPGGAFRVDVNGRDIVRGEFGEVVPFRKSVFTWGWEGSPSVPPASTRVEIFLVPDGEGTLLRLRHVGLPEAEREAHIKGWDHYLGRLAILAGGGDPGPDPWATPNEAHG